MCVGTVKPGLEDLPIGSHHLRLSLVGYADRIVSVEVLAGNTSQIQHTFATDQGSLRIINAPEAAMVSIDRFLLGQGNQEIDSLQPGIYKLTITAHGYLGYSEDVLIQDGMTTVVRTNLEKTSD